MWRKNKNLAVLFILVFALGVFSLLTSTASASTGVSPDVSFEGKIVNSSGVNITNATYNVEFTMYTGCSNEPTNNTGCTLAWTEDYLTSATEGVAMNGGTFEVNLGQYCAFSGGSCQGNTNTGINWNTYPIYMSMQIGGTTNCTPAGNFTTNCSGDGVMQPYILMTSTPYAQNAGTLGGLASGSFAQLGATQTFLGANTFEVNSGSALTVENTSAQALLTINTSTPTVNLGVTGSVALGSTVNINNSSGGIELTNIGSTALSSATVLQGGSGSLSLTTGTAAGNITLTTNNASSSIIAKSSTNSTTAFQVQNASSLDTLDVNTTNAQVDVGALSAPGTLTATQAPLAGSLTGTAGSTSYTYEITAVSANGAESLAATETNASLASSITTHNITVNWTTNGASYYKIYRTASAGTPSSLGLVGTSTTGSFVDTGYSAGAQPPSLANSGTLAVSTNYYYEVTALDDTYTTTDGIGQTSPSAQVTATTNSYNKSLTISWAPVNGARAYNVYRSTTSGVFTTDSYYTVQTNSFTDTNATATGTNTVPPTTSSAYGNDLSDNAAAQITIGDDGTETGQLYVGGQAPILIANLNDTGVPQGDYVVGSYLYVANPSNNTLQIFDISNPANPILVGTSATTGLSGPTSVAVAGQYAYLTNNSSNTLTILNVSNPSNPVLVSTVVVGLAYSAPDTNYIQGNYDYVTTEGGNTLAIVDVSNPANPILDSSIATANAPLGVVAQGNYVYVSDSGTDLVQIYNVANPYSPTLVGTMTTSGGSPRAIVSGSYAYATNGSGVMQVFDISNPADPIAVGSVATAGGGGHLFSQGHYVYVDGSNGSNAYLESFDVSNPADPVLAGGPTTVTNMGLGVFYVQGRYAYAVNNGATYTLAVFDLGGAYVQQLQVGGAEVGTLQVDSNANVSGNESIAGGLNVGTSAQVSGNLGVGGNVTVAGSVDLEGVTAINGVYGGYSSIGLATPSAPSVTFSGTTGGAVTWSYEVEAIDATGNTTAASPAGSITTADSNGLGTYSSETTSSATTFTTPHVTYNVPSGQPFLTGMGISVSSCSGTAVDNGNFTITSETTSTIVVSNSSGVAGETGCVVAAENNSNIVSWTPVTGAVNYYVFRTVDGAGGSPSTTGFIGSTTGTTLTDNATAGTATYLAQTTDSTNSFIDKTATNSTTGFSVQNSAGTNVLNVNTTNAQVDVGALSAPGTLTATQAPLAGTATGSGSGASYTYEITAVSANGAESLGSTETMASNGADLNSYPITINWTPNGAAYYKIYRIATTGGTYTATGLIATGTGSSFTDYGDNTGAAAPALASSGSLPVSNPEYYEVTALDDTYTTTDGIGQSAPSPQLTGTTNPANGSLTISWAPVNGARGYNVYRTATSGNYTYDYYYTVYTNSFTDTANIAAATGTNTVPPTTSSAYGNDLSDNANAQITVGDDGTETGQLYVGGSVPVRAIGSIVTGSGSDACGVAVQGDYAYVTNYSTDTFQVYDVSNPTDPILVSSQSVTGACGVSIEGHYAYVLDYATSLFDIFDISNPTNPLEVSSTPTTTTPTSVYVSGRYAYITNVSGSNTLEVFDITNPLDPIEVDSVTTGVFPNDVYVQGGYAYVVNAHDDTLQIFDVSNPTDIPAALSTIPTGGDPNALYVQGPYAYVVDSTSNEMQVFDISSPSSPVAIGSLTTASAPNAIYGQGRTVYIAEDSVSVQAVDVSNPADPLSIGTVGSGTTVSSGLTPDIITAQGRYVYMLGENGGNNLQIFDVGGAYVQQLQAGGIETGTLQVDNNASVSGDESVVGGLTVGSASQFNGNVGVGGDVVIGTSSSANNTATTTQELYVSGESNPTFVSQSTTANLSGPAGVAVSGDYAYVASRSNNELVSYDISSGTPVYVGESNTNLNNPQDVVVQGDYAYVTSSDGWELVIFNISSGIPVYVSEIGTDLDTPWLVQVQGEYAYVENQSNDDLVVFNISNPAHPTFSGVNTDSHVTGSYEVYVQGNYAYETSYGNNELVVYNISSGTPVYVGESSADLSYPQGVVVQGNYAYVSSNQSNKIVVFDIASGTPVLVGENSDNNLVGPDWLSVQGNYLYVDNHGPDGLAVYDISSGIPVYVGQNSDSNLNDPTGIAIEGNYAYVAAYGSNTLSIYNLGGEYAQQLQVGGEEVSQLQVDTNENVSGNESITGGLVVGSSAQVSGGLGVNGTLAASGSVDIDSTYGAMVSPTISGYSTATTGGTLAASTYYYEITAEDATGAQTAPSNQITEITTGSTSTVTLTWAPIAGAESYNVYRSTTSGVYTTDSVYATQGTVNGSNLTFTDTGATAVITNTAPPTITSAQVATSTSNSDLQVSIGGNGTPTGQLYVSGNVPTSAIGTVSTGATPNSVAVVGNYAYAINYGSNALQVINVSNPADPVVVSTVATYSIPNWVYAQGNYAYVTDWSGYLEIFNVSNPASPVLIDTISITAGPIAVYVQGQYAYTVNYGGGLTIVNISNPYTPVIVGSAATGTTPDDVYVQGNYAYVTNQGSSTLQIINISNPAAPFNVSTTTTDSTPDAVYVQGNYAYVGSLYDFQIFNISNLTIPVAVGSLGSGSGVINIQGDDAYMSSGGSDLEVVDISNPTNPTLIGSIPTGTGAGGQQGLVVQGRYAYDTNGGSNTLQVFDLGGEYSQQLQAGGAEVGTLQVDTSANISGSESITGGLAVGGATDLAGNVSAGGFSVTDGLASPANPTEAVTCSGTCATSYSYAVAAINSSGSSAVSGSTATPLTANASLNTTTEYNQTAWAAVSGASSYNVYRTAGGAAQGLIGTVNYNSALTPASASETGATVTLNFASAPPWAVGQAITLAGFTTTSVNGTWPILSVTATSITLNRLGGSTGAVTVGSGTATGDLAFYDTGQAAGGAAPTVATAGTITLQTTSKAALLVENASSVAELSVDTLDGVVIIGSNNSSNTTQTLLQLNSDDATFTEAASCTTSTNQGALYYNNLSNNIRACINGSWQDLVSTQDLALQLFGVVPNSGTNPGDLIGASATTTAYTGGPCKVTYSSATSVNVASCLAYSGGREVSVPNTNVPIGTVPLNDYENICLTSSGTPVAMGGASATDGLQTAANLTNTNATTLSDPLLCLATIKSTTANDVNIIYDIRTFSTTIKTYGTLASATQVLGGLITTGTAGLVANTASATANVLGVLVAGTNATATAGTLNVLYATIGPQWIKNTGTAVQADFIIPTTTTGYASALSATAATAYDQIGVNQAGTFGATCSAATFGSTDCQQSVFTDLDIQ